MDNILLHWSKPFNAFRMFLNFKTNKKKISCENDRFFTAKYIIEGHNVQRRQ